MAGLFSSLSMASRSLEAQRAGLDVAGQNIANLNTPGYTRRRLELAEVVNGTGGVEVLGTRALRDRVLDARVRTAIPDEAREGALVSTLSVVETAIGAPGKGIDAALSAYFDAFSALTVDPTSTVARDGVLLQGRQLATAFNATAARLNDGLRLADNGVRESAAQVNTLAKQIASLNDAIAAANGVDVDALKDRQNLALEELSGLTQVAVLSRSDGGVDVTIPSGRALVIGGSQYGVTVGTGPGGLATLALGGADITAEITNGKIGGLLHARDTLIPAYQTTLDELAHGVATEVNTLHQGGVDLNGNAGIAFFTPPAGVAGAAAAFRVAAPMIGNPSLVAASQSGAPGDNQVAKAIAALRDQPVLGGTTSFIEGWAATGLRRRQRHRRGQGRAGQPSGRARPGEPSPRSGVGRVARRGSGLAHEVPTGLRGQREVFLGGRRDAPDPDAHRGSRLMRSTFHTVYGGVEYVNVAAGQAARARHQIQTGKRVEKPSDDPAAMQRAVAGRGEMRGHRDLLAHGRFGDGQAGHARHRALERRREAAAGHRRGDVGEGLDRQPAVARLGGAHPRGPARLARRRPQHQRARRLRVRRRAGHDRALRQGRGRRGPIRATTLPVSVEIGTGRNVEVALDGQSLAQGTDSTNVLDELETLIVAVRAGDNAAIGTGLAALDRAFSRATRTQSQIGVDEQSIVEGQVQLTAVAAGRADARVQGRGRRPGLAPSRR